MGHDKEGFWGLDNVPNNDCYLKISQCPAFRENIDMHMNTCIFLCLKSRALSTFIVTRIDVTLPWQALWYYNRERRVSSVRAELNHETPPQVLVL